MNRIIDRVTVNLIIVFISVLVYSRLIEPESLYNESSRHGFIFRDIYK